MFQHVRLLQQRGIKHREMHRQIGIDMRNGTKFLTHIYLCGKFFHTLTFQCLLFCFSLFHLASDKFPQSATSLAVGSTTNEIPSVFDDQSRNDFGVFGSFTVFLFLHSCIVAKNRALHK